MNALGATSNIPLDDYMELLKVGGAIVQVGTLDNGKLPNVNASTLMFKNLNLSGSAAGSPHDIEEMLQFAADRKVRPWIQTVAMFPLSWPTLLIEISLMTTSSKGEGSYTASGGVQAQFPSLRKDNPRSADSMR
ncbi:hypothetical protein BJX99DRAFT_261638 [Aspergillus californicus]